MRIDLLFTLEMASRATTDPPWTASQLRRAASTNDRQRRRRWYAATAALAVLIIAVVSFPAARNAYLHHWPTGRYDPTPLARAEVMRRCGVRTASELNPDQPTYARGGMVGMAGFGACRFGHTQRTEPNRTTLMISSGDDVVRAACGRALGINLEGWTVAVRSVAADPEQTLLYGLRSANGYGLGCMTQGASVYGSVENLGTSQPRALVGFSAQPMVQPCLPSLSEVCRMGTTLVGFGAVTDGSGHPDRRVVGVQVDLPEGVATLTARGGYVIARTMSYQADERLLIHDTRQSSDLHLFWRAYDHFGTVVASGRL